MEKLSFHKHAVMLELEAAHIYRRLGMKVAEQRFRDVLAFLAAEEEMHARLIEKMTSDGSRRAVFDAALEQARREHLRDFQASDYQRVAETLESEEDVLLLALDMEKRSVRFYLRLFDALEDRVLRLQIRELIDMEVGHVRNLCALLRLQRKSESDVARCREEAEKALREAIAADHAARD